MFKQKIAKYICAATLIFSVPSFGATQTLNDSLRNAYQNSGLLVQNRALLRVADEEVALKVAALRPIIDWSAGYTHRNKNDADWP